MGGQKRPFSVRNPWGRRFNIFSNQIFSSLYSPMMLHISLSFDSKNWFGLKTQTMPNQNWAKMAIFSQEPMGSPVQHIFKPNFFQSVFWLSSAYNAISRVQVRLVPSRQQHFRIESVLSVRSVRLTAPGYGFRISHELLIRKVNEFRGQEGVWCRSSGDGHCALALWRNESRASTFFMVSNMTELTFSRCKNSKKVTCNLPGFLSQKKDFWIVHPKWLHRNF